MTNKEAHEALEDLQRILTNYRHISQELTEANGMAILAIEKQIPKKPTDTTAVKPIIAENGACIGADVNVELLCPVCGDQVGFNENCNNYCRNCGQKIDFTEETK